MTSHETLFKLSNTLSFLSLRPFWEPTVERLEHPAFHWICIFDKIFTSFTLGTYLVGEIYQKNGF